MVSRQRCDDEKTRVIQESASEFNAFKVEASQRYDPSISRRVTEKFSACMQSFREETVGYDTEVAHAKELELEQQFMQDVEDVEQVQVKLACKSLCKEFEVQMNAEIRNSMTLETVITKTKELRVSFRGKLDKRLQETIHNYNQEAPDMDVISRFMRDIDSYKNRFITTKLNTYIKIQQNAAKKEIDMFITYAFDDLKPDFWKPLSQRLSSAFHEYYKKLDVMLAETTSELQLDPEWASPFKREVFEEVQKVLNGKFDNFNNYLTEKFKR
jgi:hypothetical protein